MDSDSNNNSERAKNDFLQALTIKGMQTKKEIKRVQKHDTMGPQ